MVSSVGTAALFPAVALAPGAAARVGRHVGAASDGARSRCIPPDPPSARPSSLLLGAVVLGVLATLSELSRSTGVTMANLSILKTGKARAVRFSTLRLVCDPLGCEPGDLLHLAPAPPAPR